MRAKLECHTINYSFIWLCVCFCTSNRCLEEATADSFFFLSFSIWIEEKYGLTKTNRFVRVPNIWWQSLTVLQAIFVFIDFRRNFVIDIHFVKVFFFRSILLRSANGTKFNNCPLIGRNIQCTIAMSILRCVSGFIASQMYENARTVTHTRASTQSKYWLVRICAFVFDAFENVVGFIHVNLNLMYSCVCLFVFHLFFCSPALLRSPVNPNGFFFLLLLLLYRFLLRMCALHVCKIL